MDGRPLLAVSWCLISLILGSCAPATPGNPSAASGAASRYAPTSAPATFAPASPLAVITPPLMASPTTFPLSTAPHQAASEFCLDPQPKNLIANFASAVTSSNGPLLAALVSPVHGMDARLFRDGQVVNYDQQHAKFLFESTFEVDWGLAPGSGLETKGSFHDMVLPALVDVFSRDYTLTCNQLQVGGTTYDAAWPYPDISYYSVHFPGTSANGNLDWRTWVLGMHYVSGKPYLYAIMQFQWEP